MIWLFSWLKGTGWSDLGFKRPDSWLRIIVVGLFIAIVLQGAALLQIKLGGPSPDISSFSQIKNNPWALLGYLVIAWTSAGFGEEIIWRGFIMTQISRLFGSGKTGWTIGLLSSAFLFGLIHAYQGIVGIVMTGLTGILFGLVFLKAQTNLWASIFAHAFTDSLAFLLIYNWDTVSRIMGI
jgi:membrane protease YdiL (CAAX protease family)